MVSLVVDDDEAFGAAVGAGVSEKAAPHRVVGFDILGDFVGIGQGHRLDAHAFKTGEARAADRMRSTTHQHENISLRQQSRFIGGQYS